MRSALDRRPNARQRLPHAISSRRTLTPRRDAICFPRTAAWTLRHPGVPRRFLRGGRRRPSGAHAAGRLDAELDALADGPPLDHFENADVADAGDFPAVALLAVLLVVVPGTKHRLAALDVTVCKSGVGSLEVHTILHAPDTRCDRGCGQGEFRVHDDVTAHQIRWNQPVQELHDVGAAPLSLFPTGEPGVGIFRKALLHELPVVGIQRAHVPVLELGDLVEFDQFFQLRHRLTPRAPAWVPWYRSITSLVSNHMAKASQTLPLRQVQYSTKG